MPFGQEHNPEKAWRVGLGTVAVVVWDSRSLLPVGRHRVRVGDTRPQVEGIQDRLVEGTDVAKERHMEAEAAANGDILVREPEDIRLATGQAGVVDYSGPEEGENHRNPMVGGKAVVKSLEEPRTEGRGVLQRSQSVYPVIIGSRILIGMRGGAYDLVGDIGCMT